MDDEATCLYPSGMWDKKSVHPKTESRFAFRPHMDGDYVEVFIFQTSNQKGKESAVLKMNYYNPPNLISQHLPDT